MGSRGDRSRTHAEGGKTNKLLSNLATQSPSDTNTAGNGGGKARATSDKPKPFQTGEGPECTTCGLCHNLPKNGICDIWNPKTRVLSTATLLKLKKHMRTVGPNQKVTFNYNFTDHLRDYCMPTVMGIDNRHDRNRLVGDLLAAAAELPSSYLTNQKVNQVTTDFKGNAKSKNDKEKKSDPKAKTERPPTKVANQVTVQSETEEVVSEDDEWMLGRED